MHDERSSILQRCVRKQLKRQVPAGCNAELLGMKPVATPFWKHLPSASTLLPIWPSIESAQPRVHMTFQIPILSAQIGRQTYRALTGLK